MKQVAPVKKASGTSKGMSNAKLNAILSFDVNAAKADSGDDEEEDYYWSEEE